MNLVPSPMCTFCGDHEATLEHLLISCTYTKNFWLSIISWLNTYNMKIDKLDEVTILFGISDNIPGNCLSNHIIILGKYTIYSQHYLSTCVLIKFVFSYDSLSSLLNTYGECSGLKLNKDKKEAYWLGSSYRNHEALDINKVNEPIKILGIFFTYDQRKSRELNFDLTLKSIRKSLSCWQWRNLTLIGKIQLVKTFAMPKFMYRASFISFDKDIIKSINSVIFNFVWRGKDKVKD